VEERKGALDPESDQNEVGGDRTRPQIVEGDRTRVAQVENDSSQKQDPRSDLDDQITKTRPVSSIRAPGPDEPDGRDRGQLPPDEECDEVAGEERRDGGASVDQGGHVLSVVFYVEREDHREEERHMEDDGEDQGEPIDPQEDQRVIEPAQGETRDRRETGQVPEMRATNQWQKQEEDLLRAFR
jgi:hypothetical protein